MKIVNGSEMISMIQDAIKKGDFDRYYTINESIVKSVLGIETDEKDFQEEFMPYMAESLKDRKLQEVKNAMKVVYGYLNRNDEEYLIDGMQEHLYLMNELAWTVLKSINKHARYNENDFDGRISIKLQEVIRDCLMPVRR